MQRRYGGWDAVALVLVAVLCALLVWGVQSWHGDRSVAQLAPRWAQAPSVFIPVQGMQVHVRDEGPRDDPHPLVLIHGTSDSLHTWQGWTEVLREQRRVIRFDLPGFGLTGPHPQDDYSIGAYVRFVLALLDQMGVRQAVLAGNSLGGQVAWSVAVAAPQRVRALVLVDAAGYAFKPESVPIGFLLARVPGVRDLTQCLLPRALVQASVRNVYAYPGRVTPALVDRYFELSLREGNRRALGLRMDERLAVNEQAIATLRTPTLILWGAQDRLIPVENGHRFARDIAASRLVVLDGLGHVPHEEDPLASLRPVREFLRSGAY
ncbi:MAG: alpha/beta fold hydrolase [Rhodoferax sp.]